jgi:hypothetical protein
MRNAFDSPAHALLTESSNSPNLPLIRYENPAEAFPCLPAPIRTIRSGRLSLFRCRGSSFRCVGSGRAAAGIEITASHAGATAEEHFCECPDTAASAHARTPLVLG